MKFVYFPCPCHVHKTNLKYVKPEKAFISMINIFLSSSLLKSCKVTRMKDFSLYCKWPPMTNYFVPTSYKELTVIKVLRAYSPNI